MKNQDWQRARTEEQVEQRIREIQDAAARLIKILPYEKVTLQRIAKELNFTRSNVYRYFTSKEEIFLSLYVVDTQNWCDEIEEEITGPLAIEDFADTWVTILLKQERFLELSSLLAISLEKNSSEEVFRNTKTELSRVFFRVIEIISKALPELDNAGIAEFIQTQQVLLMGAWPLGQVLPVHKDILRDMNMEYMLLDFPVFYRAAILRLLESLVKNAAEN